MGLLMTLCSAPESTKALTKCLFTRTSISIMPGLSSLGCAEAECARTGGDSSDSEAEKVLNGTGLKLTRFDGFAETGGTPCDDPTTLTAAPVACCSWDRRVLREFINEAVELVGHGAPSSQTGYGAPSSQTGYGAPSSQTGYGAPAAQQPSYDARDVSSYSDAAQPPTYSAQPQHYASVSTQQQVLVCARACLCVCLFGSVLWRLDAKIDRYRQIDSPSLPSAARTMRPCGGDVASMT